MSAGGGATAEEGWVVGMEGAGGGCVRWVAMTTMVRGARGVREELWTVNFTAMPVVARLQSGGESGGESGALLSVLSAVRTVTRTSSHCTRTTCTGLWRWWGEAGERRGGCLRPLPELRISVYLIR